MITPFQSSDHIHLAISLKKFPIFNPSLTIWINTNSITLTVSD